MKELDKLKEKCVQAMKDVDAFVDEHCGELIVEMRKEWNVPLDWEVKILSNYGVVHGCFRRDEKDEWTRVIYNNGEWHSLY